MSAPAVSLIELRKSAPLPLFLKKTFDKARNAAKDQSRPMLILLTSLACLLCWLARVSILLGCPPSLLHLKPGPVVYRSSMKHATKENPTCLEPARLAQPVLGGGTR